MSISTKTGDDGSTSLLYGKRVKKTHLRVIAYGSVDELGSHLGLVRFTAPSDSVSEFIDRIQGDLIQISANLASDDVDQARINKAKIGFTQEMLEVLEEASSKLEKTLPTFSKFTHAGASLYSAHCHVARTVCRRAEQNILKVREAGMLVEDSLLMYFNRLSDYIWLLAREDEISYLKEKDLSKLL